MKTYETEATIHLSRAVLDADGVKRSEFRAGEAKWDLSVRAIRLGPEPGGAILKPGQRPGPGGLLPVAVWEILHRSRDHSRAVAILVPAGDAYVRQPLEMVGDRYVPCAVADQMRAQQPQTVGEC